MRFKRSTSTTPRLLSPYNNGDRKRLSIHQILGIVGLAFLLYLQFGMLFIFDQSSFSVSSHSLKNHTKQHDDQQGTVLDERSQSKNRNMDMGNTSIVQPLESANNSNETLITFYQQQQHSTNITTATRLEFVHITKTGGSAIENLAAQNGITWGICHFINAPYLDCVHKRNYISTKELFIGTPWHAPPKVLNALLVPPEYKINPYHNADLFAVVRNPYDRAISEYYCPFFGMENAMINDNVTVMNEWIQSMIKELESEPVHYYYKSPKTRKYSSQKHYLNQVEYIYDNDGTTKLIQHVLYYEDLSSEFNALMKEYNLDHLVLPSKETHGINVSSSNKEGSEKKKKFTYTDLTDLSIACINRYAARDFETLGYSMINTMNDDYSLKPKQ